jgi:hypothetical protein
LDHGARILGFLEDTPGAGEVDVANAPHESEGNPCAHHILYESRCVALVFHANISGLEPVQTIEHVRPDGIRTAANDCARREKHLRKWSAERCVFGGHPRQYTLGVAMRMYLTWEGAFLSLAGVFTPPLTPIYDRGPSSHGPTMSLVPPRLDLRPADGRPGYYVHVETTSQPELVVLPRYRSQRDGILRIGVVFGDRLLAHFPMDGVEYARLVEGGWHEQPVRLVLHVVDGETRYLTASWYLIGSVRTAPDGAHGLEGWRTQSLRLPEVCRLVDETVLQRPPLLYQEILTFAMQLLLGLSRLEDSPAG